MTPRTIDEIRAELVAAVERFLAGELSTAELNALTRKAGAEIVAARKLLRAERRAR